MKQQKNMTLLSIRNYTIYWKLYIEKRKSWKMFCSVETFPSKIVYVHSTIYTIMQIWLNHQSIILDGSLSLQEKLDQIWAHTKDSFVPIIKVREISYEIYLLLYRVSPKKVPVLKKRPQKLFVLLCCIRTWGSFLDKWNVFMGQRNVFWDTGYKHICTLCFVVNLFGRFSTRN